MSTVLAEDRIAELDKKLDFIVDELASLKRLRENAEDLAADLSLAGKSAMRDAVEVLGTADLRPGEIVGLFKSVLANAQLFEKAIRQLQSAADFIEDAQPIVRDVTQKAIQAAESLSQRGYCEAASAGMRAADILVRSHSVEDWRQAEASVPQLIGFLRELTKPEVLQALESMIHCFTRVQGAMNVNKSAFALVRDLNSPEARRGLAMMAEFLKAVGARAIPATPKEGN